MFKYVRAVLIVVSLLFAWSCDPEPHSIKLSDTYITFNGKGNDARTVTVISDPTGWKAVASASWIQITEMTAQTLTFTVDDNEGTEERRGSIDITAGKAQVAIEILQLTETATSAQYRTMFDYENGVVMSPSGKYAGGWYASMAGDALSFHVVVYDIEADKKIEIGTYPGSLLEFNWPTAISDDGLFFIETVADGVYAFSLDGTYEKVATPAGMVDRAIVSGVATNGTKVGFAMKDMEDGHGSLYWPVKWVNGEAQELQMPKTYRDELEYTSAEFLNGVMARGISANGEIVYGTCWDNWDFGMVYWDQNGDVRFVGEDVRKVTPVKMFNEGGVEYDYNLVEGVMCTASSTQSSPSGKWLAGTFTKEELNAERTEILKTSYPAFYNTETKKTYLLSEYSGVYGLTATDDGKGIVGGGSTCTVVDIESGIRIGSGAEWIQSEFGIVVPTCRIDLCCAGGNVVFASVPYADQLIGMIDGFFYVAR